MGPESTLPMTTRAPERPTEVLDATRGSADLAARHPLRILVADDGALTRAATARTLAMFGYGAVTVPLATVAGSVRNDPYDLVLVDVAPPRLAGLDVAREVLAARTTERTPRVVATSALPEAREAAFALGIAGFLPKPLDPDALRVVLCTTTGAGRRV